MKRTYAASAILIAALMVPFAASAEHSGEVTIVDVPEVTKECVISGSLGIGSRGTDVECLQKKLIAEKLLALGSPTGYFGAMTKTALSHWQEDADVPSTGYFGEMSRAKFYGLAAMGAPAIRTHAEVAPAVVSSMVHAHEPLDVSAWAVSPSVSIVLHKDSMSGYNVEIIPTNFRFAPEHVNGEVVPNEGHAHLFVNGTKIARVYGPWFHVGKEDFASGHNEILVTLNVNDHSEIAVNGMLVQATSSVTM